MHHRRRFSPLGVDRKIEKHRPWLATFPKCSGHCLIKLLKHKVGFTYRARVTGEWLDERSVHHVLQRTAILLFARGRTREHQYRCPCGMRISDAGHRIRYARTSRHEGNTNAPAELSIGMCHIYSRALITNIDDTNAFGVEPHPDRHDVAPTEREYTVNPACPQKASD